MMEEILAKLPELSLEELGEVTKESLARIYSKLRDEEGFGYYQGCLVTSMGREPYDVTVCIVDADDHNPGSSWDHTHWL